MFRRFPTKEALLAAVLAARLERLAAGAEALAADPDPGAALDQLVRLVVGEAPGPERVRRRAGRRHPGVKEEVRGRLRDAVAALLERARAAGAVPGPSSGRRI